MDIHSFVFLDFCKKCQKLSIPVRLRFPPPRFQRLDWIKWCHLKRVFAFNYSNCVVSTRTVYAFFLHLCDSILAHFSSILVILYAVKTIFWWMYKNTGKCDNTNEYSLLGSKVEKMCRRQQNYFEPSKQPYISGFSIRLLLYCSAPWHTSDNVYLFMLLEATHFPVQVVHTSSNWSPYSNPAWCAMLPPVTFETKIPPFSPLTMEIPRGSAPLCTMTLRGSSKYGLVRKGNVYE